MNEEAHVPVNAVTKALISFSPHMVKKDPEIKGTSVRVSLTENAIEWRFSMARLDQGDVRKLLAIADEFHLGFVNFLPAGTEIEVMVARYAELLNLRTKP